MLINHTPFFQSSYPPTYCLIDYISFVFPCIVYCLSVGRIAYLQMTLRRNIRQHFSNNALDPCLNSTYVFIEKVISEINELYKKAGVRILRNIADLCPTMDLRACHALTDPYLPLCPTAPPTDTHTKHPQHSPPQPNSTTCTNPTPYPLNSIAYATP